MGLVPLRNWYPNKASSFQESRTRSGDGILELAEGSELLVLPTPTKPFPLDPSLPGLWSPTPSSLEWVGSGSKSLGINTGVGVLTSQLALPTPENPVEVIQTFPASQNI